MNPICHDEVEACFEDPQVYAELESDTALPPPENPNEDTLTLTPTPGRELAELLAGTRDHLSDTFYLRALEWNQEARERWLLSNSDQENALVGAIHLGSCERMLWSFLDKKVSDCLREGADQLSTEDDAVNLELDCEDRLRKEIDWNQFFQTLKNEAVMNCTDFVPLIPEETCSEG